MEWLQEEAFSDFIFNAITIDKFELKMEQEGKKL